MKHRKIGQTGLEVSAIGLAWLLVQKPWIVPIPGTKKLDRLQENLSAAYVELSSDDISRLTKILTDIPVYGERYSPENMRMVGK